MIFSTLVSDRAKLATFSRKSVFGQPGNLLNSTATCFPKTSLFFNENKIKMESHSDIEIFRKQLDENYSFFEVELLETWKNNPRFWNSPIQRS